MEARDRNPDAALSWAQQLDAAPRSSFFALVSFLERVSNDAARVGSAEPPRREAIRFRHDPDLIFPTGDVHDVQASDDEPTRFDVLCTFLGLSGSASPLPLHMTESVLFDAADEGAQRDFLDVFHHRLYSLFYRAVIRLDPAREYRTDGSDPWLHRMLGLAGIDRAGDLALESRHLMRLIPVLTKRSRGAAALRVAVRALLQDDIPGARVAIRELVGGWITIDEDQCTLLGTRNHALGSEAVLGRRVHDKRGRFAIRLSTLSREQADMFDEGTRLLDQLRDTVSLVVSDPLEYDLEIEIEPFALRPMTLGTSVLGRARVAGFEGEEVLVLRNVGNKGHTERALV